MNEANAIISNNQFYDIGYLKLNQSVSVKVSKLS